MGGNPSHPRPRGVFACNGLVLPSPRLPRGSPVAPDQAFCRGGSSTPATLARAGHSPSAPAQPPAGAADTAPRPATAGASLPEQPPGPANGCAAGGSALPTALLRLPGGLKSQITVRSRHQLAVTTCGELERVPWPCPRSPVSRPSRCPRVWLALDVEGRLRCPGTLTGRLMRCFANRELHQDGLAWELPGPVPCLPQQPGAPRIHPAAPSHRLPAAALGVEIPNTQTLLGPAGRQRGRLSWHLAPQGCRLGA